MAGGVEVALAATPGSAPGRARHVLLCTTAALRPHDASRLARRFAVLGPTAMAITKIDETGEPVGIVHGPWATKLPVSVLCFGQRVPEDIAPATPDALVDYLVSQRDKAVAA
jgi:flagellar biosynthesis protein FlhF